MGALSKRSESWNCVSEQMADQIVRSGGPEAPCVPAVGSEPKSEAPPSMAARSVRELFGEWVRAGSQLAEQIEEEGRERLRRWISDWSRLF